VRGFFENGGQQCYVVPLAEALPAAAALQAGLALLAPLDTIDLVCAPDLMRAVAASTEQPIDMPTLQGALLEHCDTRGDRFALLDAVPGGAIEMALAQRQELRGQNGALYFPWLDIGLRDEMGHVRYVPSCGHVAGVYARSDARVGVHKAPANEILEGVLDLETNLTDAEQGLLNPVGVNALRAFTGRGIRVWGARTLSPDLVWRYINVRRLFLTAGRWIERNLADVVFEPNDRALWARITRELTAYFTGLFQQGALQGDTPARSFYVKCDAALNPPAVRDLGQVITEIGLAPAVPGEFIVVRIIHGASGIILSGPA
jgi:phage tail sheath protein FI